jgi:hypothetical protein
MKKEKGNYVFPNLLAKMMKGVSERTQYEAEMMAIVFILGGIIVFGVFIIFFTESSLFLKILTAVNLIAAFVFLSSRLVTSFQQYQNYLAVMGIINEEQEVKNETI